MKVYSVFHLNPSRPKEDLFTRITVSPGDMESKTAAVNKRVVPQWSSLVATTSKLEMQPRRGKPRTLVPTKPSNTKALRIETPRATPLTVAGTWNTHISPKKNPVNKNSALKEVTPLAMMDSFITGTSLSSDLNTPEIRIDNFAFTGKTVKGHDADMAANSLPGGMKQSDSIDGTFIMECLPKESESLFDPYILLDMSPGSDVLQAEQLEERINVQEFASAHEGNVGFAGASSVESPLASWRTTSSQSLTASDTASINAMESLSVIGSHSAHNIPQLSISDDDNLNIPEDLLEEMDNLFPNLTSDLDPSSTDLDMYIGTHDDLLFGAMEQSGMLNFELNGFGSEGFGMGAHAVRVPVADQPVSDHLLSDESCTTRPTNMFMEAVSDVQPEVSELGYTDCLVEDPLTFVNIDYQPTIGNLVPHQSSLETPKPSTSYTNPPQRPSKKRQSLDSETLSSAKRSRRTSRKPLRFRDSDIADLLLQDESNGAEPDNQLGTAFILKEEPEVYETTSLSQVVKVSNSTLTEQEKYHRIRILNNEASKRCRQKRKENLNQLEIDLQELEERNENLQKKHDALLKLRDRLKPFVMKVISQGLASSQGAKN